MEKEAIDFRSINMQKMSKMTRGFMDEIVEIYKPLSIGTRAINAAIITTGGAGIGAYATSAAKRRRPKKKRKRRTKRRRRY